MLKPRITARQLIWISAFLLMLTILMMTWSTLRQQESTLATRDNETVQWLSRLRESSHRFG